MKKKKTKVKTKIFGFNEEDLELIWSGTLKESDITKIQKKIKQKLNK
jgi:hypothetical protein